MCGASSGCGSSASMKFASDAGPAPPLGEPNACNAATGHTLRILCGLPVDVFHSFDVSTAFNNPPPSIRATRGRVPVLSCRAEGSADAESCCWIRCVRPCDIACVTPATSRWRNSAAGSDTSAGAAAGGLTSSEAHAGARMRFSTTTRTTRATMCPHWLM
jgi:hypothetical protein